jgi:hypothetical protein
MNLSGIGGLSWMVRKFYQPHSSLADESLEADGNESAASISCALGMFQVD